jgi:16S rRNA processing protein RimM
MNINKKLILLGIITKVHGIKGHIIVKSFTNPKINICSLNLISENSDIVKLKMIGKTKASDIICQFNNVISRNEAEKLIGFKFFCDRSSLAETKDEEFYIQDLIGRIVKNSNMEIIGEIFYLHNFGAGDIVEIKFLNQKTEMFPFNEKFFPEINNEYVILQYHEDY